MLPSLVVDALKGRRRVLLAGCGGGYDIFGAVPLLVALREAGHKVHLASLSFCYLNGLDGARQHQRYPNLYAVPAEAATEKAYCPEAWLGRFLLDRLGERFDIWGFDKTGVRPLASAYQHLVEELKLDAIVLLDGGIDAILRGDESSLGTPAEDLTSLAAVMSVDVPTKLIACVGLGAEIRDGICHEQVLARIAELTRAGGYLGSFSLVPGQPGADLYANAVAFAFRNQEQQRKSHIHNVVVAAMRGEFGSDGEHVWLSPLLSVFWFFCLPIVAKTHLFLADLAATDSIWDVTVRIEGIRKSLSVRERTKIPI